MEVNNGVYTPHVEGTYSFVRGDEVRWWRESCCFLLSCYMCCSHLETVCVLALPKQAFLEVLIQTLSARG